MEKHEKVASFLCRGRMRLWVYSWHSLPDFKHDQKCFIRIPSVNIPEMRPLGTFCLTKFWAFSSFSKESHVLEGDSNIEVEENRADRQKKWMALTQGRKGTEYLMSFI